MPVDIIVGLQWGDEGKGKIVDILAPSYQIVARYQGGPNAGHTLVINQKKFVFHTLPSGVVQPHAINVLGAGMVIDPVILRQEIEKLSEENIDIKGRLKISRNAHLILPTHRLLDRFYEFRKGENKIGSTLKGISPAYQDKYGRSGLVAGDILKNDFSRKYQLLKQLHLEILGDFENPEPDYEDKWLEAIEFLKNLEISDTELYLNRELAKGANVLAEGAQGALLDINFGSYPFVTSSNTISSGACVGLGIAPLYVRKIFGVFKAYATRVGEGPFITEQKNKDGEKLRDIGREYGSTTGRPRRCGWLDLVALNYAIIINGVTDLAITKSDVLDSHEYINICTQYKNQENQLIEYSDIPFTSKVSPVYQTFKGWQMDISNCHSLNELPAGFIEYINFIRDTLHSKISVISTGPDRNQTILLP